MSHENFTKDLIARLKSLQNIPWKCVSRALELTILQSYSTAKLPIFHPLFSKSLLRELFPRHPKKIYPCWHRLCEMTVSTRLPALLHYLVLSVTS
jgi:hypothetical protein